MIRHLFSVVFCPLILLPAAVGATPVRLNMPFESDGDVATTSLMFSPGGDTVLYLAKTVFGGATEAYVVPSSGGESKKVNGLMVNGGNVVSARFSPGGERIVFHARKDSTDRVELYSATLDGTASKLNGPIPANSSVGPTHFTADGAVVYAADQDAFSVFEAYVVPVAGGEAVKLNGPLVNGGDATIVHASLADGVVLYIADQEVDQQLELFAAAREGTSHWKLSAPMEYFGNVNPQGVRATPDGLHVVYVADANLDGQEELFRVPVAGGEAAPLSPTLINGGDVVASSIRISPPGDRVLYLADQDVDNVVELYGVPTVGGAATKLNGPLVSGGNVFENSLSFSPDGSKVLYLADQNANDVYELFIVSSSGGESLRLNSQLTSSGDVSLAQFSSDGQRIVYLADQDANDVVELFSVAASGGDPVRLNEPLLSNQDVMSFQISPDGQHVVFRADQQSDNEFELYHVPIAGTA